MFFSTLESLPDEILLIIFQYFDDIYSLFRIFFGFNQRLNSILVDKRSHLFTNFLHIHKSQKTFHLYYNSIVFKTVSEQIFLLKKNTNDLDQYFQLLISFHIHEQYNQMKFQVEVNRQNFQSLRQNLHEDKLFSLDTNLKQTFENLQKSIDKSTLEQIQSLVLYQGACLEYTDQEQAGFYFAEDFCQLFKSTLNLKIIQIFKILFISNLFLLKYPCYHGGYRLSIYEFLFYYYYSFYRTTNRALIDLILFTTQCQKILFYRENWMEKVILMILDILSKTKVFDSNEFFYQVTQVELLKILLDEYKLLEIEEIDNENFNKRFRGILEGLIRLNRFDIILLIYRSYKPVRDFFNYRKNIRDNVNILTGNRIRRDFFLKLIDENPQENWLIKEDLIFILLEKKERKILEKLLTTSPFLTQQLDKNGNNLLLFICLKVSGCRHRIIEFLIQIGCDLEKQNHNGEHFYHALKLKKNQKLLKNLIKHNIVEIRD